MFNSLLLHFDDEVLAQSSALMAGSGNTSVSGVSPSYAQAVNLVPSYEIDSIRFLNMIDFLPVGNEITIKLTGYRNAVNQELSAIASFTVTIYDDDETTEIATGSLSAMGAADTEDAGNYSGSVSCVGLTANSRYKVVIEDNSAGRAVWTRWFTAAPRPTLW